MEGKEEGGMHSMDDVDSRCICRAFGGDISALAIVDVGFYQGGCVTSGEACSERNLCVCRPRRDVLLIGMGSILHGFSLFDGKRLFSEVVLPDGVHVHGICPIRKPYYEGDIAGRKEGIDVASNLENQKDTQAMNKVFCPIIAFGGRFVRIMNLTESKLLSDVDGEEVLEMPAWVMAADLVVLDTQRPYQDGKAVLTIALSDNSARIFLVSHLVSIQSRRSKLEVVHMYTGVCNDRCLLYSADIFVRITKTTKEDRDEGDIVRNLPQYQVKCFIAGGTILYDVVIWEISLKIDHEALMLHKDEPSRDVFHVPSQEGREINTDPDSHHISNRFKNLCNYPLLVMQSYGESISKTINEDIPVLLRLGGHEGSIHTVAWSSSGQLLASGSDDRTLRVWNIKRSLQASTFQKLGELDVYNPSELIQEEINIKIKPQCVLYGHLARLWRVRFSPRETIMASASEDGACKLWNVESGQCIRTISKAHRFRGVWHCAFYGTALITAGADGAVKMWNLWDWMPPKQMLLLCDEKEIDQTSQDALTQNRYDMKPWDFCCLLGKLPHAEEIEVGYKWKANTYAGDVKMNTKTRQGRSDCTAGTESLHCKQEPIDSSSIPQNESASENNCQTCPWESVGYFRPGENPKGRRIPVDSRFERPRCLELSSDGSYIFMATNQGVIYMIRLPDIEHQTEKEEKLKDIGNEEWTVLYKNSRKKPLVSLNVVEIYSGGEFNTKSCVMNPDVDVQRNSLKYQSTVLDIGESGRSWLLGAVDLAGFAIIVRLPNSIDNSQFDSKSPKSIKGVMNYKYSGAIDSIEWNPYEQERQISLGVFFAEPLLHMGLVFVPGGKGELSICLFDEQCWRNGTEENQSTLKDSMEDCLLTEKEFISWHGPTTLAHASCPNKARVVNIKACHLLRNFGASGDIEDDWLIATGASCGSLILWKLSLALCSEANATEEKQIEVKSRSSSFVPQNGSRCPELSGLIRSASLEPLKIIQNTFKIQAPLKCLSMGWFLGAQGSSRIKIECGTTAGTVERFEVVPLAQPKRGALARIPDQSQEEKKERENLRAIQDQVKESRLMDDAIDLDFGYQAKYILRHIGDRRCESVGIVAGCADSHPYIESREIHRRSNDTILRRPLVWGFSTTNFVVYDEESEMEICSVYIVAQKKPWAAVVSSSSNITMCFAMLDKVHVYRRFRRRDRIDTNQNHCRIHNSCFKYENPSFQNSSNSLVDGQSFVSDKLSYLEASLHHCLPCAIINPGHGNDINSIRLIIPQPRKNRNLYNCCSSRDNDKGNFLANSIYAITGGEDASVRYCHIMSNRNEHPTLMEWKFWGQTFGSSVRSLALSPAINFTKSNSSSCGRRVSDVRYQAWILVAACAKQIMSAWICWIRASGDDSNLNSASNSAKESRTALFLENISVHSPNPRGHLFNCKAQNGLGPNEIFFERECSKSIDGMQLRCLAADILLIDTSNFRSLRSGENDSKLYLDTDCVYDSSCSRTLKREMNDRDSRDTEAVPCQLLSCIECICLSLSSTSDGSVDLRDIDIINGSSFKAKDGDKVNTNSELLGQVGNSFAAKFSSWHPVAHLQKQNSPVISVKLLMLQNIERVIAFMGNTSGTISVWNISDCIFKYLSYLLEAGSKIAATEREDNLLLTDQSSSSFERDSISWTPPTIDPIYKIAKSHQSGINDLGAAVCDYFMDTIVLVVTGGDDQALHLSLLEFANCGEDSSGEHAKSSGSFDLICKLRAECHQECAHSSAIRGVWTDGRIVYSVGIDRKLRRWRIQIDPPQDSTSRSTLDTSVHLVEDAVFPLQVVEPSALDVSFEPSTSRLKYATKDSQNFVTYNIGISGKGVQVLSDTVHHTSTFMKF